MLSSAGVAYALMQERRHMTVMDCRGNSIPEIRSDRVDFAEISPLQHIVHSSKESFYLSEGEIKHVR